MTENKLSTQLVSTINQMYVTRYFTNHGPLARKFENEIALKSGCNNAVAVNSYEIALLIAINSLGSIHSIHADNLEDVLYNVLELSGISQSLVNSSEVFEQHVTSDTQGTTNLIITPYDQDIPKSVIKYPNCMAMIDQTSLCEFQYKEQFDQYIAIVDLSKQFGISPLFGGAVLFCDEDELAEKFRNMRSSYGVNKTTQVKATCNGRFSELQAGLFLQYL